MGATYTYNKFFSCHRQSFRAPFGEGAAIKGLTHMRSMCVGVAETGVEHCSPAKNHKVTFLLSYFSVTKSTKSQQREHSPLFANLRGVHELAARAMRGKCVRQMAERKSAILRSAQSRLYHACEQSARKSRADSCTHCLHARYKCRAGVAPVPALTG